MVVLMSPKHQSTVVIGVRVFPKIGVFPPKMDGENNGKPQVKMDDLLGKPTIFGNTRMVSINQKTHKKRPTPKQTKTTFLLSSTLPGVAEFFADVGGPLVTPSSPKQSLPKVPQNSEPFFC